MVQKNLKDFFRHLWQSQLGFVLIALLCSYVAGALFDPEYLLFQQQSFITEHDTEIPYQNTFMLLSFFYNGGVQLWDRYDQMNIAFYQLTGGVFTVANIIQAIVYVLLEPLVPYPGQLLHGIHTIGFFLITAFLRTVGGYLLLRYLGFPRWIILVVSIYINTFFSSSLYNGLLTNNLYSYFPLFLYVVLKFFDHPRINNLLTGVLVMTVSIANSPLFALNYYYQAAHMFIFSCTVFKLFSHQRMDLMTVLSECKSPKVWLKIVITAIICSLIIAPNIILMKSAKKDFHIAASGVGDTQGRMQSGFNPVNYFKLPFGVAGADKFLIKSIDYSTNEWWITWPFIGLSTLMFSVLGLFFSRDRRRLIFITAVILIVLVNSPKDPAAITSLGHWINALTNPFHFLVRSFHMSGLVMPYIFAPLLAFGLQTTAAMLKFPEQYARLKRFIFLMSGAMVLIVVSSLVSAIHLRWYLIAGALAFLILLAYVRKEMSGQVVLSSSIAKSWKFIPGIALVVFICADGWAFSYYVRHNNYSRGTITPQKFSQLQGNASRLILDFQNPRILPWREYFRSDIADVDPPVYRNQNNYGLFYHFTPTGRYLYPPNLSRPMHIGYKLLHTDQTIHRYLNRNNSVIFFAAFAVDASQIGVDDIIASGLENHVITVEKELNKNPLLLERLPSLEECNKFKVDTLNKTEHWIFDLSKARKIKRLNGIELRFKLPESFPSYVSTTVFTKDWNLVRLSLGDKKLIAVQGHLVEPFTFDVRNIRDDQLRVLLPKEYSLLDRKALLEVQSSGAINRIWRNEYDRFGFDYTAPHDGWLVFHYPYDTKWRLLVDDASVKFSKVNGYFMGVFLSAGEHKIFMEYWPQTPVRWMIVLSSVLVFVALGVVFFIGFRNDLAPKELEKDPRS